MVPLFALIYWWLPDGEFRVPDGGSADYGGCLYYSIVTITTLGFGDYTPCGVAAQCVTAVEVMCGLITIGFFLNAVGSMKSEIDVETELEKRRRIYAAEQRAKLLRNAPVFRHKLNLFLSDCDAIGSAQGNAAPASDKVAKLIADARSASLFLDSLQARVDMSLWPHLLDDAFAFVAEVQLIPAVGSPELSTDRVEAFIRRNSTLSRNMLSDLDALASSQQPEPTA